MIIQCEELVDVITADQLKRAPQPADVPPIPPEIALTGGKSRKNLDRSPWLFHEILDPHLDDDVQLELF